MKYDLWAFPCYLSHSCDILLFASESMSSHSLGIAWRWTWPILQTLQWSLILSQSLFLMSLFWPSGYTSTTHRRPFGTLPLMYASVRLHISYFENYSVCYCQIASKLISTLSKWFSKDQFLVHSLNHVSTPLHSLCVVLFFFF